MALTLEQLQKQNKSLVAERNKAKVGLEACEIKSGASKTFWWAFGLFCVGGAYVYGKQAGYIKALKE